MYSFANFECAASLLKMYFLLITDTKVISLRVAKRSHPRHLSFWDYYSGFKIDEDNEIPEDEDPLEDHDAHGDDRHHFEDLDHNC